MDAIRKLETYTAPLKILICFVLLAWVYNKAGGFGDLLSAPSQFVEGGKKAGQFWSVFWPSLTAMVGFWATLALNIPDFTRFAKSQRDQVIGQSVGLPVPMGLLAAMAVIVTSATVVLYGKAIWDPVELSSRMTGAAVLVALLILLIDTVSSTWPPTWSAQPTISRRWRRSDLVPHRRLHHGRHRHRHDAVEDTGIDPGLYLHLADRLFGAARADRRHPDRRLLHGAQDRAECRRAVSRGRSYSYGNGWNMAALVAFVIGVLPNIPGFLNAAFPARSRMSASPSKRLYTYAWFVGIAISAVVYGVMMKGRSARNTGAGPLIEIQEMSMTTIIRGGTVVNADRAFRADVLCYGDKIVAVGEHLDAPPVRQGDRRRRPVCDAGRDRPAHPHEPALHGHRDAGRFLSPARRQAWPAAPPLSWIS
jgi:NCS1 family nucleobase:cation symporter-1